MQVPLEISFRGINDEDTEVLEQRIRTFISKLEALYPRITSCSVAVEKKQRHQKTGNPYRIRIAITAPPGQELVVKKESMHGDLHDTLFASIQETFKAARRRLLALKQKQQRRVKTHPQQEAQAFVSKIFKEAGYGFIETVDGREVYFHRNAVLHDQFDNLEIGTGVSYNEHMGHDGPQASSVQVIVKPEAKVKRVRRAPLYS